MKKRKTNLKVVIFSLLAIGFLILTFTINWMFIIGAVILMILNQRELFRKNKYLKKVG